ncbi:MAG: 50S ribosomal protein L11 methyltransferase [Calditrichaeota bacterium]|nr:MAG: 50S ribosomal protein L11 methyltransferase [Calditrichota bacterium]
MNDTNAKAFIEASVEVPKNISDAVCNFIIENITSGLLLEEEEGLDTLVVKFYMPDDSDDNFRQKLSYYFQSLLELDDTIDEEPDLKERVVENIEWEDAYRESIKGVIVSDKLIVRPPWEEYSGEYEYDIVIEPKMAFGTGTHETTKSCLEIILKTFKKNKTFLDLGCGSGILSILADKMGAKSIKAIDYDMVSVENCFENFEMNDVACDYEVLHGSIELCESDEPYDYVCANIIKSTILTMLDKLNSLTKSGGTLVLSGLLDDDVEEIEEHLLKIGLSDYEVLADNEWRSFTIRKK